MELQICAPKGLKFNVIMPVIPSVGEHLTPKLNTTGS